MQNPMTTAGSTEMAVLRRDTSEGAAERRDMSDLLNAHNTGGTVSMARYVLGTTKLIFLGEPGERPWLNVLLFFTPLAFISSAAGWTKGFTFAAALLALCPFAERLGYVTEDLAKTTNATVGGLLNATFGNLTEAIVCIFALANDKLWVVQVTLIGSIFSNLLLVLGSAFLLGGIRILGKGRTHQTFNGHAATNFSAMLLFVLLCIALPTVLAAAQLGRRTTEGDSAVNLNATNLPQVLAQESRNDALYLSRGCAVCMLATYGAFLLFQLRTHATMFEDDDADVAPLVPKDAAAVEEGKSGGGANAGGAKAAAQDEEESILGFRGGCVWLGVMTIFISFLSEFVVDAIEGAAQQWGAPHMFIGAILVPIVGNAAEHASAIVFAYKDKMALSIGIAVGSAAQIGSFVFPLMVICGWAMGQPLSFDVGVYNLAIFATTILLVPFVIRAGTSTWLSGALLVLGYCVVGVGYWFACNPAVTDGADACAATLLAKAGK